MSKEDWETSETLLNPYIEIGEGIESRPNFHARVNVSTFKGCLGHLKPPFTDRGPNMILENRIYCVYGVVGRTITGPSGSSAYLNVDEPPISRTLMGFLIEDVLKTYLPKVHRTLTH